MQAPIPFTAVISVGDCELSATPSSDGSWYIEIRDVIDNRTESKSVATESEAAQVVADFCQPTEPGKAFADLFPFWV